AVRPPARRRIPHGLSSAIEPARARRASGGRVPNSKADELLDVSSMTKNRVPGSGFFVLGSGSAVPGSETSHNELGAVNSEPETMNEEPRTQNLEPRTQNPEPGTQHASPLRFWRSLDELADDPSFRERLYNEFPSEIETITD